MAFIKGADNVLFIRRSGGDFVRVGFLTVNAMDNTTEFIDVTNRVDKGFKAEVPIQISTNISFTALIATDDELVSKIGYKELLKIQNNFEQIEFKLEAFNQNFTRQGAAFLASLSESSPAQGGITFDGSLNVFGRLFDLEDLTPPETPFISIEDIDSFALTATLSWTASTDNIAVAGYEIRKSQANLPNQFFDVGDSLQFTDVSLQYFAFYAYNVRAYDIAGNYSAWSNRVSVLVRLPSGVPPQNYKEHQNGTDKMYQNGTLKTYQ